MGIDQRARTARASAGVEVSPTVGPEAISAGSSPGMSEIISDSTRAGQAAAASWPPFTRLRCLRTMFISPIGAPEARRASLTACFSARVIAPAGCTRSAEPPPETRATHDVVLPEAGDEIEHPRRRREPARVGHRMRRFDDLDAPGRAGVAVAGQDQPLAWSPGRLNGLGHARRRLAGADHHHPAGGLGRQRGGHAPHRVGGGDGRVEERAQEAAWVGEGHPFRRKMAVAIPARLERAT